MRQVFTACPSFHVSIFISYLVFVWLIKHCMPQCGAIMCDCTQRATPRSNNWHCQINLAQCSLRSLCNHSSPPLYFFQPQSQPWDLEEDSAPPYFLVAQVLLIHSLGNWQNSSALVCLNFSLWATYNLKAQISKMRQPREDSVVDAI